MYVFCAKCNISVGFVIFGCQIVKRIVPVASHQISELQRDRIQFQCHKSNFLAAASKTSGQQHPWLASPHLVESELPWVVNRSVASDPDLVVWPKSSLGLELVPEPLQIATIRALVFRTSRIIKTRLSLFVFGHTQ